MSDVLDDPPPLSERADDEERESTPLHGIDVVDAETDTPSGRKASRGWRAYLRAVGPGLVTGASDDDPSGIATYAQAGAKFQFGLLWTALLTFPLMATVQEICDRTALATGQNLGELARRHFHRTGRVVVGLLLCALLVANTLNITADLLAVGSGVTILIGGPVWLWSAVAGATVTVLVVTGSFTTIARVFKLLCIGLLAYIVVLFFADVHWRDVLTHTLVPHVEWDNDYLALLVAVLGTTISPYLFFWQSAHRVEALEADDTGERQAVTLDQRSTADARHKQRRARFDVFFGMGLSNVVMFAIMVATGATIGANGSADINSAADAASALRPVAGSAASALFALGFIGAGMLAIPVLAGSASTGLSGLIGKDWGFSQPVRRAPLFYALVGIGTIGGTALSLAHIDPIAVLVIVAVINGIAAAPFLVIVMLISRDRGIMGDHANRRVASTLGWSTVAVMTAAAAALIATTLTSH